MAERVLRDHSEKCDHDADWYWEGTPERRVYLCNVAECPGGREVTITEERSGDRFRTVKGKVKPQRRWVTKWEPSRG